MQHLLPTSACCSQAPVSSLPSSLSSRLSSLLPSFPQSAVRTRSTTPAELAGLEAHRSLSPTTRGAITRSASKLRQVPCLWHPSRPPPCTHTLPIVLLEVIHRRAHARTHTHIHLTLQQNCDVRAQVGSWQLKSHHMSAGDAAQHDSARAAGLAAAAADAGTHQVLILCSEGGIRG